MKIFLLILLPFLAFSWWDVGHMITASIAEIRLKQLHPYAYVHFRELITSINHLVDNRSRTLVQSACWPDDIKGKNYNMHLWDSWHFIDKPNVQDGVFPVINFTQTSINSVAVIQNAVKVIGFNINQTTAERALFARYLVHVIGDIHQPLHSATLYNETFKSGDRGGNSLNMILLDETKQNLHAFWDAGAMRVQNNSWAMVRPLNSQNQSALQARALDFMKEYGESVAQLGKQLDPAVWAKESLEFAKNTTYPFPFSTNKVTESYAQLTYETSKKRITLAGYRIANVVIQIYEDGKLDEESVLVKWERMKKFSEELNMKDKKQVQME